MENTFTLIKGATYITKMINNIEILRSLRSLRMTGGKGVNVFSLLFSSHLNVCQKYNVILNLIQDLSSYRFRLGGRNDSDRKELINKPSPAFVVFANAQTQLLPLTKREGNKKRKELINLSTYPLINFQKAFTLAEVLITLAIIGIVAAMTIPTLISNMASQRYRTQFKKTVSTLSQAARLNKARYDWDYADVSEPCDGGNFHKHTSEVNTSVCAILNSNLSSIQGYYRERTLTNMFNYKFNGSTVGVSQSPNGEQYTVYSLADGTLIGFRSQSFSSGCTLPVGENLSNELVSRRMMKCTGFIDVNGVSLPNEETKCSVGTTSLNTESDCIVKNKDMKDVFPIVFHDSIVEGATNAARYVLQTTK